MYEHKTPPTPPQNTPFPSLNMKVGQINYILGILDPKWAKCLKSGQNFSRNGQKKNIHLQIVDASSHHCILSSRTFTPPLAEK